MDVLAQYAEREAETAELAQDWVEEVEEGGPMHALRWQSLSDEHCRTLTGLGRAEFSRLHKLVIGVLRRRPNGRGCHATYGTHDRLLMLLCHLKHYETIAQQAKAFGLSKSRLHEVLHTTSTVVTPLLCQALIVSQGALPRRELFADAVYVLGEMFQPTWIPDSGEGRRTFWNESARQHGLKSLLLHDRDGRVRHCVAGERGAMPLELVCEEHEEDLRRVTGDWRVLTNAELPSMRCVAPQGRAEFDATLAQERSVAQRYQALMRSRHRVLCVKYRGSRDEYWQTLMLCVCLTNLYLQSHPLPE